MEMNENSEPQNFSSTLQCFGRENHVMLTSHKSGETLGLVLVQEFSNLIGNITVEPMDIISDHNIVSFKVKLIRSLKGIDQAILFFSAEKWSLCVG